MPGVGCPEVRAGGPVIARAARGAWTLAREPLRRLVRRFPWLKREARTLLQHTRAGAYRSANGISARSRRSPASAHARVGVYVAYFDAAEIYGLHLSAFRRTRPGRSTTT